MARKVKSGSVQKPKDLSKYRSFSSDIEKTQSIQEPILTQSLDLPYLSNFRKVQTFNSYNLNDATARTSLIIPANFYVARIRVLASASTIAVTDGVLILSTGSQAFSIPQGVSIPLTPPMGIQELTVFDNTLTKEALTITLTLFDGASQNNPASFVYLQCMGYQL